MKNVLASLAVIGILFLVTVVVIAGVELWAIATEIDLRSAAR